MSDHLPCLARAGNTGGHWTSLACAHTVGAVLVTPGRAGAAANISIQIRYCTAAIADKPFGKMQNPFGYHRFDILSQRRKTRQT
jgi:hypothetical protein